MQEVERSSGSEELLIARQRSRLGRETVRHDPSLAEAGESGPEVRVGSVQAAVHVSQVVAHVSNLEVAPHPIILAVTLFDEKLAQSRRSFVHHTVIAERWVIIFGIDAPE